MTTSSMRSGHLDIPRMGIVQLGVGGQSTWTSPVLQIPSKIEVWQSNWTTPGQLLDILSYPGLDKGCPTRFGGRKPRSCAGFPHPEIQRAERNARSAVQRVTLGSPSVLQTFARLTIAVAWPVGFPHTRGNTQKKETKWNDRTTPKRFVNSSLSRQTGGFAQFTTHGIAILAFAPDALMGAMQN
jgi:hypothetical protein